MPSGLETRRIWGSLGSRMVFRSLVVFVTEIETLHFKFKLLCRSWWREIVWRRHLGFLSWQRLRPAVYMKRSEGLRSRKRQNVSNRGSLSIISPCPSSKQLVSSYWWMSLLENRSTLPSGRAPRFTTNWLYLQLLPVCACNTWRERFQERVPLSLQPHHHQ